MESSLKLLLEVVIFSLSVQSRIAPTARPSSTSWSRVRRVLQWSAACVPGPSSFNHISLITSKFLKPRPLLFPFKIHSWTQCLEAVLTSASSARSLPTAEVTRPCSSNTTELTSSFRKSTSVLALRHRTTFFFSFEDESVAAALLSCATAAVIAPGARTFSTSRGAVRACADQTLSQAAQLVHASSAPISFHLTIKHALRLPSMVTIKTDRHNNSSAMKPPYTGKEAMSYRRPKGGNTVAAGAFLKYGNVDQRRMRPLTVKVKEPRQYGGESVVCYLQRDLRVQDNWALLLAHDAAAALRVPLHVVHLLVPGLGFQPTPRHLHFFYGGARDVEKELFSMNIGFHMPVVTNSDLAGKLMEAETKIEELQAALQPAAVVCDFFPLRLPNQIVDILKKVCEQNRIPLYQVDAHSVVPAWILSDKQDVACRTLRPRLHALLRDFFTSFPLLTTHPYPPCAGAVSSSFAAKSSSSTPSSAATSSPSSRSSMHLHTLPTEERLQELLHIHEGPAAIGMWTPGAKEGLQQLQRFCCPQTLAEYGKKRNDPLAAAQSNLSPYLHFGQLSQQRCLLEVSLLKKIGGEVKTSSDGGSGRGSRSSSSSSTSSRCTSNCEDADLSSSKSGNNKSKIWQSRTNSRCRHDHSRSNNIQRESDKRNLSAGSTNSGKSAHSFRVHPNDSNSSSMRRSLAPSRISRVDVIAGVDEFIEEAIVRCALSENFVFYCPDHYDDLEGAPRWARESLLQHAKDPRVPLYDLPSLEAGETYDALWNAAQQQLIHEGKMHGYLRMYWAKKMLEWMASPAVALAGAIYLNDKYSLDGTDPNGYTGCMWSVAALHDQPFQERPIYGKVRYMNYAGCRRKFDVDTFVRRYSSSSNQTSSNKNPKKIKGIDSGSSHESGLRSRGRSNTLDAKGETVDGKAMKKAKAGAGRPAEVRLLKTAKQLRERLENATAGEEEGVADDEKQQLDETVKQQPKRILKEEQQEHHDRETPTRKTPRQMPQQVGVAKRASKRGETADKKQHMCAAAPVKRSKRK